MRALIIDDDPDYRSMLNMLLSPYGQIDEVEHGTAGFKAFCAALKEEDPYDLLLIDVMMPRRNGFDTVSSIRLVEQKLGLTGSEGVKIIIITGVQSDFFIEKSLRLGCEGICFKAEGTGPLIEKLRELGLISSRRNSDSQSSEW